MPIRNGYVMSAKCKDVVYMVCSMVLMFVTYRVNSEPNEVQLIHKYEHGNMHR